MDIKRTRVTWTRWDSQRMRNVTSHPYVWLVTEPDGYERTFDTRAAAEAYVASYVAEIAAYADGEQLRGYVLALRAGQSI